MLLKIISILLVVTVAVGHHQAGAAYPEDDSYGGHHQDNYEENHFVKVKRFESSPTAKTLSAQEIREVRAAINQILSGYDQDNRFIPATNEKRSIPDDSAMNKPRAQTPHESYTTERNVIENKNLIDTKSDTNEPFTSDVVKTSTTGSYYDSESNDFIDGTVNILSSLPIISSTDDVKLETRSTLDNIVSDSFSNAIVEAVTANDIMTGRTETISYETKSNTGLTGASINPSPLTTSLQTSEDDIKFKIDNILGSAYIANISVEGAGQNDNELGTDTNYSLTRSSVSVVPATRETEYEESNTNGDNKRKRSFDKKTDTNESDIKDTKSKPKSKRKDKDLEGEYQDEEEQYKPAKRKCKGKCKGMHKDKRLEEDDEEEEDEPSKGKGIETARQAIMAMPVRTGKFKMHELALLELIANLTHDYEMDLTRKLNKTLQDSLARFRARPHKVPTTTTEKTTVVENVTDAATSSPIVAKCFVCGMDAEKIPRDTHCADAFSHDFIPLFPVDLTAGRNIPNFRKYCRFEDVHNYNQYEHDPRSVFGRWSGGCAVRWTDLSGVYTQRTCRSRKRAVLGNHYASKRMAKLEMALGHVEDGCITSPMATLIPLSRGISLYSRFHACVCTGHWCNVADAHAPWTAGSLMLFILAYI